MIKINLNQSDLNQSNIVFTLKNKTIFIKNKYELPAISSFLCHYFCFYYFLQSF